MLYVAFLIIAIALNLSYKRNLLLVLVVGLSSLIPMQMSMSYLHQLSVAIGFEIAQYYIWWAICLGFELLKITMSYKMRIRIGYPISFLCSLMLLCHLTLLFVDNLIPHTVIVPILEHLEVLSCILFSPTILQYLKRKIKCR